MSNQYVVYCAQPDLSQTWEVGISVPWSTGEIPLYSCASESELQGMLGRFGIGSAQVSQIVSALGSGRSMYILPAVTIDDDTAQAFGIELHDGYGPDEKNAITLTRCSSSGGALMVSMVMNDQIMPAPVVGCFAWHQISACLRNSGQFTAQQLHAAQQSLQQSGTAQLQSTGASTGIIACIAKLPASGAAAAPAPPSSLSGTAQ